MKYLRTFGRSFTRAFTTSLHDGEFLWGVVIGAGAAAAYIAAGWPGEALYLLGCLAARTAQRVAPTDAQLRRPRWLYHWHAHRHGYFWMPCRVCGREFSGWESSKDGWCIYGPDGTGNAVCSGRCAKTWRYVPIVKLKLPNQ